MGKEEGGIVVECVQSFCFARGKKSWGLVAQNVNVLNMEMEQDIEPMSSACLLSVVKAYLKKKFNPRSKSMQKQRKTIKGECIIIII